MEIRVARAPLKTRIELWNVGMFPVQTGYPHSHEQGVCVPLALVMPHEKQADRNHGQTLHRLAERGGLSACELAAVLEDREWRAMPEHEGWAAIFRAAAQATRPEAPTPELRWLTAEEVTEPGNYIREDSEELCAVEMARQKVHAFKPYHQDALACLGSFYRPDWGAARFFGPVSLQALIKDRRAVSALIGMLAKARAERDALVSPARGAES